MKGGERREGDVKIEERNKENRGKEKVRMKERHHGREGKTRKG